MSTTRIDYDLVVQELSKGMWETDSEQVACFAQDLPTTLLEFRTLRLGAGRQRGSQQWVVEKFGENPGHTLILSPHIDMNTDIHVAIIDAFGLEKRKTGMMLGNDVPDHMRLFKFNRVYILDAGIYFSKFKLSKVYEHLATCTTDDVIIYHLN